MLIPKHPANAFGPAGRSIGNALSLAEDLPTSSPIICLEDIQHGVCAQATSCLNVHVSPGKLSRGNAVAQGLRGRAALTPIPISVAELSTFIGCSPTDARRLAVGAFECPSFAATGRCSAGWWARPRAAGTGA